MEEYSLQKVLFQKIWLKPCIASFREIRGFGIFYKHFMINCVESFLEVN